MTIWKDVPEFEGIYQVSNDGKVKNYSTGSCLKFSYSSNGYCRVKLYKKVDGKRYNKMFMAHRLVASAFLDNPMNKPQVNHLDGDKHNNRVENLEWCTQSENLVHSVRTGLRDMSCCTRATKKPVLQSHICGEPIKIWDSMSEAARALGIPIGNISHCCAGELVMQEVTHGISRFKSR